MWGKDGWISLAGVLHCIIGRPPVSFPSWEPCIRIAFVTYELNFVQLASKQLYENLWRGCDLLRVEAMYADLGHFCRRPIKVKLELPQLSCQTWYYKVLHAIPCGCKILHEWRCRLPSFFSSTVVYFWDIWDMLRICRRTSTILFPRFFAQSQGRSTAVCQKYPIPSQVFQFSEWRMNFWIEVLSLEIWFASILIADTWN